MFSHAYTIQHSHGSTHKAKPSDSDGVLNEQSEYMKARVIPNMNKVAAFVAKVEQRNSMSLRETWAAAMTEPRLAHVYKDRSLKSSLPLELKTAGMRAGDNRHWSYKA